MRSHGQQAIAGELFPLLDTPDGQTPLGNSVAIVVGFAAGLGLMFGLDAALDKCNPEDDDGDGDNGTSGTTTNHSNADASSGGGLPLAVKKASTAGREDSRGSGREGAADADADYDGLSGGLLEAGSPVDYGSSAVRTENAPGGILAPDVQAFVGRKFDDMAACLASIQSNYDRSAIDHVVHRMRALVDECNRVVRACVCVCACLPACWES